MTIREVLDGAARWAIERGDAYAMLLDLPEASVDALICDPPYSSGGFTRGDRTGGVRTKYVQTGTLREYDEFDGDNRDQRGFYAWCSLWLGEAHRVLRPGAPALIFSDWRQLPTVTDAFQAGGFVWRGVAVWSKGDCSRPQMGRFRSDAEFVVWGSKGPMREGLDVGVLPGTWVAAPGIVLDPFAGSGTTLCAALRTGRRAIGFEINAGWLETARARVKAEDNESTLQHSRAGQSALFERTDS